MSDRIQNSISSLKASLIENIEDHFSKTGIQFDKTSFLNEANSFLDFVVEQAHFAGGTADQVFEKM